MTYFFDLFKPIHANTIGVFAKLFSATFAIMLLVHFNQQLRYFKSQPTRVQIKPEKLFDIYEIPPLNVLLFKVLGWVMIGSLLAIVVGFLPRFFIFYFYYLSVLYSLFQCHTIFGVYRPKKQSFAFCFIGFIGIAFVKYPPQYFSPQLGCYIDKNRYDADVLIRRHTKIKIRWFKMGQWSIFTSTSCRKLFIAWQQMGFIVGKTKGFMSSVECLDFVF